MSTSGSLIFVEYIAPATVPGLEELFALEKEVLREHGHVSLFQVITGPSTKMEEAARQKAAEMTKALEGQMRGMVLVVPGNSLGATIIRTTVTAINALARSRTPVKCVRQVDEGLLWLQALEGQDAGVCSLRASELEALLRGRDQTSS